MGSFHMGYSPAWFTADYHDGIEMTGSMAAMALECPFFWPVYQPIIGTEPGNMFRMFHSARHWPTGLINIYI